jgi:hypothetical protein
LSYDGIRLESMKAEPTLLLTVGHGAASEEDFRNLLQVTEVASVVDVWIGPGSRKHPHFGKARLEEGLPTAGIGLPLGAAAGRVP